MTVRSLWSELASPSLHDELRSVELVRLTVAAVLFTHPLHAALHPADVTALAAQLTARGAPFGSALAVLGLGALAVACVLLIVRRWAGVGALLAAAVVAAESAMLHAPHWFVLGGEVSDDGVGVEYGALLVVVLTGIAVTWWSPKAPRARTGLLIIAVGSALSLLPHGYGPFIRRDFEGMRQWGEGMSAAGWPFGVQLVWTVKIVEFLGVVARVARRFVVPACLGHLFVVLIPGMIVSQQLAWFCVGPGDGGIEFPVVLSAGAVASLLAWWPRRTSR